MNDLSDENRELRRILKKIVDSEFEAGETGSPWHCVDGDALDEARDILQKPHRSGP